MFSQRTVNQKIPVNSLTETSVVPRLVRNLLVFLFEPTISSFDWWHAWRLFHHKLWMIVKRHINICMWNSCQQTYAPEPSSILDPSGKSTMLFSFQSGRVEILVSKDFSRQNIDSIPRSLNCSKKKWFNIQAWPVTSSTYRWTGICDRSKEYSWFNCLINSSMIICHSVCKISPVRWVWYIKLEFLTLGSPNPQLMVRCLRKHCFLWRFRQTYCVILNFWHQLKNRPNPQKNTL